MEEKKVKVEKLNKVSVGNTNKADEFVKKVFSEVPETYDKVNNVLTLGLDIVWRKKAAKIASSMGGSVWMDMCTGTGEMAANLCRLAPKGTRIIATDFSSDMMDEARKKPEAKQIEFVTADIKALPFEDNSIDLITMSFATRNINLNKDALIKGFSELHRVLKPGGCYVNVETSQPSFLPIRKFFHLYVKLFVKQIGKRMSGSLAGYLYLSKTIPKFYNANELASILKESGFKKVKYRKMLFGVAAIHQSWK